MRCVVCFVRMVIPHKIWELKSHIFTAIIDCICLELLVTIVLDSIVKKVQMRKYLK